MSEPGDLVLAYWADHRQQLRQSEDQWAVLTNYILVIVAALSGLGRQAASAVSDAGIRMPRVAA